MFAVDKSRIVGIIFPVELDCFGDGYGAIEWRINWVSRVEHVPKKLKLEQMLKY